jgi:hypothetical protein
MANEKKTPAKKATAKRKPAAKKKTAAKKPDIKAAEIQAELEYIGQDDFELVMHHFSGEHSDHVLDCINQFGGAYGCTFVYVPKFVAFKLLVAGEHLDWISVNALLDRFNSQIPRINGKYTPVQRPYTKDRIY